MRWKAAVLVVACTATGLVAVPAGPGAAVAPSYSWEPARVDGGGFVTALAPSPVTTGLWLAASDVAGVFRSTDGGRTWTGATRGFENVDHRKVGAVEWDPFNPARAWACAGTARATGPAGAVLRTTDAGVTWATVSTSAFCSGGVFSGSGVTDAHPRSIGRLLVADRTVRNRLWLGTVLDGVRRSTDGGVTWTPAGLAGQPVRGLAPDPVDPNVLYAAVRSPAGGGVYRTRNANDATPTWELLAGPPMAEELSIVNGRLYVAAGTSGVWAADLTAPTPVLTRVGQGSLPWVDGRTDAASVSATVVRGVETVLLGLDADAACIGTYCPTIWRSVDRGATWSPLPADAGGVRLTVGGPTGDVWRQAEVPATLLGGTNHVVGDVQFDPFTRTRIVMAGRAGIWRSGDSGAIWYPVVRGLAMTFHGQPSVGPGRRRFGGRADRRLEPLQHGRQRPHGGVGAGRPDGDGDVGAGGGLDRTGQRTPLRRRRFRHTAVRAVPPPAEAPRFTALGFGPAANSRGVLAVAARDIGGQRVVVAIGRGTGTWRRVGDGPWTRTASVSAPGGPDGTTVTRVGRLAWTPGGALYASDTGNEASTGVWRSLDAGITWERITTTAMDIAADAAVGNRLWLAGGGEVWRVDDARVGTVGGTPALTITQRTSVPAARLVATDPTGGVVVVTAQIEATTLGQKGTHGRVLVSTNGGRTFLDRTTDAVRPGLVEPVGLTIEPNGTIHVVSHGFGWWVGRPS